MGVTTVEKLFDGPWGIVASRRKDIENGSFGVFERVYAEEVDCNFLRIQSVAAILDCHESTARGWLFQCDSRFIVRGLAYLYFKPDVDEARSKWVARQVERKARKAA